MLASMLQASRSALYPRASLPRSLARAFLTNRRCHTTDTTNKSLLSVTDSEVEEFNKEIHSFFGDFSPTAADDQLALDGTAQDSIHAHKGGGVVRSAEVPGLTHVDHDGRASMVDVGMKASTHRTATASGVVILGLEAFQLVEANQLKKGDVLSVAQLAGIMGAKSTSQLIPLCHNIFLSSVDVRLRLDEKCHGVRITSVAKTVGMTGVEMEALTATSVAALTVYDMCKAISKEIVIQDIMLEAKSGGNSGDYSRRQ